MNVRTVVILVASVSAWLVSCTTPPPIEPPDIGVEMPDAWVAGEAVPGAVDGPWWRSFGDTSVEGVIREALRNNRDLRASAARVAAAVADARIAGADKWPHLSGGFGGERGRQNFIGFPIPGGGEEVLSTTSNRFGLSLDISWELDLWGRIRSGERAALADLQAAEADLAAAYLSLTAQTVRGWFAVTEAQKQVELGERAVASYRETAKNVGDRVATGLVGQVDERLAQADLATAGAALAQRQVRLEREKRQLEVLLGRYPSGRIVPAAVLPALPGPVPAGLPAEMVARRPDVAAAERRLTAADARVAEATAALYPRISLTASGGTSTEEFSDLLDGDFRVWSIAGNLLQPIFEGGRLRARVSVAEAEAKEALETYADTVLVALGEVESALAVEAFLGDQEERLTESVSQAVQARDLADDRYRQGVETLLLVLEAQRRALVNESDLISVRRLRLENRIDLHLALGGGFEFEVATAKEAESNAPEGGGRESIQSTKR